MSALEQPRWHRLVYWLGVWGILVVAGALQVASAAQDSQTADEAVHLSAGYSYWKTGDFRLNPEHPPLSKLISALPLLWLSPDFAPPRVEWERANQWAIGQTFLYANRVPADRMLMAGRFMTTLLSLLLGLSVAAWVAARSGYPAGLLALVLLVFEPTVLAHSRYVTSDLAVTLFIWLTCISWYSWLERGGRWLIVRTGVLLGLALASKHSALFLPLALLVIWRMHCRIEWRSALILFGTAVLVLVSAYGFDTRSVKQDPGLTEQIAKPDRHDSRLVQRLMDLPVPGYYYLRGIHLLLRHEIGGHLTYFMGKISDRPSWLYFPAAFILKSSLGWLGIVCIACIVAFERRLQTALPPGFGLTPGLYVLFAVLGAIAIGVRHLLPVYPFLCAFSAVVILGKKLGTFAGISTLLLLVVYLIESATAYPNYLSFFNSAAGGPTNGYRYLLDSNLDWGQDLKRLKAYSISHDIEPMCLGYFGSAEPSYYGIRFRPLPPLKTAEDLQALDCVAAVSLHYLYVTEQLSVPALKALKPNATVGASIHLFDLRKK